MPRLFGFLRGGSHSSTGTTSSRLASSSSSEPGAYKLRTDVRTRKTTSSIASDSGLGVAYPTDGPSSAWEWDHLSKKWQQVEFPLRQRLSGEENLICAGGHPLFESAKWKMLEAAKRRGNPDRYLDTKRIVKMLLRERVIEPEKGYETVVRANLHHAIEVTQHACTHMQLASGGLNIARFDSIVDFIKDHKDLIQVNLHEIKRLEKQERLACVPPRYEEFVAKVSALYLPRVRKSSPVASASSSSPAPRISENPLIRAAEEKIKEATHKTGGRPMGNMFDRHDTTAIVKIFFNEGIFVVKEGIDDQALRAEFRERVLPTQELDEEISMVRVRDPEALVIFNFDLISNFAKDHKGSMTVSLRNIRELQSKGLVAYTSTTAYREFAAEVGELYL